MQLQKLKIRDFLGCEAEIHLYDTIDSTNNEAKRRSTTDRGVHLYASMHQSAGRGRRGHSFYSPKGTGLYMTLSLPIGERLSSVQKITCAAGVAVCEAIAALSDLHPQIKWVNDILVGGKKVAGILTELISDSDNRPSAVIVGIGLNLHTADFPAEFAERAGNLGDIEVNALCGTIASNLINLCENLDDHSVIEAYKALNLCIGQFVRYTDNGATYTAKAVDINADGSLVVEKDGIRIPLNSGEISIVIG